MSNEIRNILNSIINPPGSMSIFSIDKEYRYIAFNENYKRYLINTFNIEPLLGISVIDLFGDFKDKDKEMQLFDKALAGKEFTQVGNYSFGSRELFFKDLYRPIYSEDNEVVGVTIFYDDITERKRSEKMWSVLLNISEKIAMSESLEEFIKEIREELSKIIDTTNFYVALYNKDTGTYRFPFYADAHDEIDKLTNISLKRTATDYVRNLGAPLLLDVKAQYKLISDGKIDLIGTPCSSWMGVPLKNESEPIGVMVIQSYDEAILFTKRDLDLMAFVSEHITKAIERKRIMNQLRKTHLKLKYAQFIAKLGHWELDIAKQEVKLSDEAMRIYGDDKAERISVKELLRQIHQDDRKRVAKIIGSLGVESMFYDEVFRIINKKTQEVLYIHSKAEFDKSRNRITAMVQDVTEQQLAKIELHIAKEKAEESDVLKSVFLANMSHEIRTPMNAILGFSKLMLERNIGQAMQKKYAEYINSSAKNLLSLINDILDVAKIESGQFTIIKKNTYLNVLLDEIYAFFSVQKKTIGKEHIDLKLVKHISSNELTILTDSLRLRQILTNLIGNSLKFTETGSIEFGYTMADQENFHFYVKDTGIGIPEEKREIVFSRFGQVVDNKINPPGGTGLGLSISKHLVEALGGEIGFTSKHGSGTIFHFTLPFAYSIDSTETNKQERDIIKLENVNDLRMLVVEDNKINQILFSDSTQLDLSKNTIDFASSGEEAIELFLGNEYDIVFMDVMMPGIDGYETTERIREIPKGSNIPIIGLSAHAMKEAGDKAIRSGMNDFITKPFVPDDIRRVIGKYVGKLSVITYDSPEQIKRNKPVDKYLYEYINLNNLKMLYGTKTDKLKKIIGLYAENIDSQLENIHTCFNNNEFHKARIAAHTLKSGLRYLGMDDLGEVAKEIEEQVGRIPEESMVKKIEYVDSEWRKARVEALRISTLAE